MLGQLTHHGVLGMHWGRRKGQSDSSSGSPDHRAAQALRGKKLSEMSNDEIKIIANRLSLERQYKEALKTQIHPGKKIAIEILGGASKQLASELVKEAMTGGVKKLAEAVANKRKG